MVTAVTVRVYPKMKVTGVKFMVSSRTTGDAENINVMF